MTEPHLEHSIFGGHDDAHDGAHEADSPRCRSAGPTGTARPARTHPRRSVGTAPARHACSSPW